MKPLFYALRPKQWIKNLFVFLPLVFGMKLFDVAAASRTAAAFALFCMMSSAVYLLNDVLDYPRDRFHRTKRLRSVASGKVTRQTALWVSAMLASAALAGASVLDASVTVWLAVYLAGNALYTLYLKDVVILDVFCLGAFFILRIATGTAAADVHFSYWMVVMVALLAMFLGFNKRRQELRFTRDPDKQRTVLAKYGAYFIDQMISMLTSSIVVVYILYTLDERTVRQFGSHHLLWSVPFVYYGIFRYLYLVHRRKTAEDPTLVLYTDGMMLLNLLAWVGVCIAVIYFKG